jgi:hypothetical protein
MEQAALQPLPPELFQSPPRKQLHLSGLSMEREIFTYDVSGWKR